jgi:hypothetical protein
MKQNATYFISILLIFLFVYTACSKLTDSKGFVAVLQKVPLIGRGAGVVAILLPLAELLIALLLLFEGSRLTGLYASLVLLFVFTVYLVFMVLVVPHLPCSCGGVIGKMSWKQHIVFNVVCIGLTVVGIRSMRSVVRNYGLPGEGAARVLQIEVNRYS